MIFVTGGTGRVGRHVLPRLLAAGARVRVLVRSSSRVPANWEPVELAVGDLGDPRSLRQAMAGVGSVLLLSPMVPWLDHYDCTLVAAAEDAGAVHVVKLSTTTPEAASPISWWRAHWRAEERVRASPVPWTVLRPNGITMFMLGFADEIRRAGTLSTAAGDGRMALIDPDDVAAVAVEVLVQGPGTYDGSTLALTGPEAVSYDNIAATLGDLLGRSVRHRRLDPDAAAAHLASQGLHHWEAEGVLANWLMTRDGIGDFARVTDTVPRILGRPARTVRAYLADNLGSFRDVA